MSAGNGTVVVVEDDQHIADLVDLYLRREGFRVLLAGDGEKGLQICRQEDPWIVILDVGLPGSLDGFDVCRAIRTGSSVPVLFLTARDDEMDRVLGLELGADDYLVKPFSPRELVARVRAILRRSREGPPPQDVIAVGDLEVDLRRREVRRGRGRRRPDHPRVRPARVPGQQRRPRLVTAAVARRGVGPRLVRRRAHGRRARGPTAQEAGARTPPRHGVGRGLPVRLTDAAPPDAGHGRPGRGRAGDRRGRQPRPDPQGSTRPGGAAARLGGQGPHIVQDRDAEARGAPRRPCHAQARGRRPDSH